MADPVTELLPLQNALAGRYAVERLLGQGGMGLVFLARDLTLERPVAIKLLAPALARDQSFRSRFLREARSAARLSHPNIVPVHSVEDHGELVCFIMGFIDGETLSQRVRRAGPLPPADAYRLLREVAWALGHAHAVGIVHRDVKPDNLLLERHTGRAVVTDFGLAAPVGREPGTLELGTPDPGARMGTPAYMSPEQVSGEPLDGRSDLYSLGATGYFAVTGRPPFEGSLQQMLAARLTRSASPVQSTRPDVPTALAQAIDRCLARERTARPDSAEALLELLREQLPATLEAPLPVSAYVREAGQVLADVSAATVAGSSALIVYGLAFRNDLFAAIAFYPIAALLFGLGLTRFGELVLRTRQLVRQGYSLDAVKPAVDLEVRKEEAERRLDQIQPRGLTDRPAAIAAIGAVKTALFIWLATRGIDTLTLIGVAGTVLIPAATLRQMWRSSGRSTGVWGRILKGTLGRWLFRIGRVGQRGNLLPAADAPTAVFLGEAAQRLFEALPEPRRRELAQLPDVLSRLQADALESTDGHRMKALAALENLRLDLLRLQAGEVQSDQLTRDLDQARQLSRLIDERVDRR